MNIRMKCIVRGPLWRAVIVMLRYGAMIGMNLNAHVMTREVSPCQRSVSYVIILLICLCLPGWVHLVMKWILL